MWGILFISAMFKWNLWRFLPLRYYVASRYSSKSEITYAVMVKRPVGGDDIIDDYMA